MSAKESVSSRKWFKHIVVILVAIKAALYVKVCAYISLETNRHKDICRDT